MICCEAKASSAFDSAHGDAADEETLNEEEDDDDGSDRQESDGHPEGLDRDILSCPGELVVRGHEVDVGEDSIQVELDGDEIVVGDVKQAEPPVVPVEECDEQA